MNEKNAKRKRAEPVEVRELGDAELRNALSNWNALCVVLSGLTIPQVNKLLRWELKGERREPILYRLHIRKMKLIKTALWDALTRGEVRDAA